MLLLVEFCEPENIPFYTHKRKFKSGSMNCNKMAAARTLLTVVMLAVLTILATTWYLNTNPARVLLFGLTDYLLSFLNILSWQNSTVQTIDKTDSSSNTIFTQDTLRQYDGTEESLGLHLAFLGRVYDVSGKGDKFYGPGGGYSFFAGRDATRAFITGEFNEEGLKDDVDGFTLLQMGEVMEWVDFYETDYIPVGVLQGRYYDHMGHPTEERERVEELFREVKSDREARAEEKRRYPYCDINKHGTSRSVTMSCVKLRPVDDPTNPSIRFPRKYFKPGVAGWRCACVETDHLASNTVAAFEGCAQQARECLVSKFDGFYN